MKPHLCKCLAVLKHLSIGLGKLIFRYDALVIPLVHPGDCLFKHRSLFHSLKYRLFSVKIKGQGVIIHVIHFIFCMKYSQHIAVCIASRETRFEYRNIRNLCLGLRQHGIQILDRLKPGGIDSVLIRQILPVKKNRFGALLFRPWHGHQLAIDAACGHRAIFLIRRIE